MNTKSYDAIVVGAGFVGCAVAYNLVKSGLKTALIERGDGICSGASGGNYGCIQVQDAELEHSVKFVKTGKIYFDHLEDELGTKFHLRPRYSLLVIETENQLRQMKNRQKIIRDAGIQAEIITANQISEIEPLFNHKNVLGALYHPFEGQVYPFDFAWAFFHRAQQLGLDFLPNTCVTGFILQNGNIRGVQTRSGNISSASVVLTTGAWTRDLGNLLKCDWKIPYITGQAYATETTPQKINGHITSAAFFEEIQNEKGENEVNCSLAIAQSVFGNILFGESSSVQAGFQRKVSFQGITSIIEQAAKFFPILKNLNVIRSWAVPVANSTDKLPFLGAVSGLPGLIIATAFHSTVITTPLVGILVKQIIFKENTEMDITAFSPDRVVCG